VTEDVLRSMKRCRHCISLRTHAAKALRIEAFKLVKEIFHNTLDE
jgi:hypothetical protein